jgi:hypothetical protein
MNTFYEPARRIANQRNTTNPIDARLAKFQRERAHSDVAEVVAEHVLHHRHNERANWRYCGKQSKPDLQSTCGDRADMRRCGYSQFDSVTKIYWREVGLWLLA